MKLSAYFENEDRVLHPDATRSAGAVRRHPEQDNPDDYRTPFQHDRDRIIHCLAFKRLKEKTQVFAPERSDHLRNRLAHTMEVTQLARTAARALNLNEDLTEAIALGHDLGHAPFGHSGEFVLDRILTGEIPITEMDETARKQTGGFKHNYQSVRISDTLENRYPEFNGINLTDPVREGMLKHTGIRGKLYNRFDYAGLDIESPAQTPEAAVVALADEIAQQCHDLEDGIRLKTARVSQLMDTRLADVDMLRAILKRGDGYDVMNDLIRSLFRLFMDDLVNQGLSRLPDGRFRMGFSETVSGVYRDLREFVYTRIIYSREVARSDEVARSVITGLFGAFYRNPMLLPDYVLIRTSRESGRPYLRSLPASDQKKSRKQLMSCDTFIRAIADYIGGMTDGYAIREFHQIYP